jgi:hypothetical protein
MKLNELKSIWHTDRFHRRKKKINLLSATVGYNRQVKMRPTRRRRVSPMIIVAYCYYRYLCVRHKPVQFYLPCAVLSPYTLR